MSQAPPLNTNSQTSEKDGRVDKFFHRWLSSLRKNALQFSEWPEALSGPLSVGTFTISDPEINEASRMLVIAKPDDENAMEPINVLGVTCSAGSAVVEWEAPEGGADGTRYFFYAVSG